MAKSLEVLIPTGITATAKLFTIGSDTVAETIGTLTEATNRLGTAVGTVTVTGWHKVIVFNGSTPVGDFIVNVGSTDPATYYAIDEAAVDWASVRNPTTTVGLSGTTVKTATDVESDTADIQSRIPAALVGGRIDANIGAISADATAADNAESFFDGTGYAGTNNVIPVVTTTATATNVTTVNGLAAGVITAASIATGAIDADALAADAVTEIQSGLATTANVSAVETDTQDIQNRIPAALTGAGNIKADALAINGSTVAAAVMALMNAAVENGTAQAGGASSITLAAGATSGNLANQAIWLLSGTGAPATNRITAYDGGTKVATVETAWVTVPDATSVYVVLGRVT